MQAITLEFLNAWITILKYSYIYFSPVVFITYFFMVFNDYDKAFYDCLKLEAILTVLGCLVNVA